MVFLCHLDVKNDQRVPTRSIRIPHILSLLVFGLILALNCDYAKSSKNKGFFPRLFGRFCLVVVLVVLFSFITEALAEQHTF